MQLLKRFWAAYVRKHLRSYVVGLVMLGATTLLTVAIPYFVEQAVDAMGGDPRAAGKGPGDAVAWAWAIIVSGLGVMVVRTLSRVLFFNPGREVEYDLKSDLFGRLTAMPRRYFDQMRPGDIISRGTNDTAGVRALIGFGSLQLLNVGFTLVLALTQMALSDWVLTLACLAPLALAALVMWLAIRRMFGLFSANQEQLSILSARVLETYNGTTMLQSFNAMDGATAAFDEANEGLLQIGLKLVNISAWLLPIASVVGTLCLVIVLWFGGLRVMDGDATLGSLAAFVVLIRVVVGALMGLGWVLNAVQRGWISLGRVYDVLDAESAAAQSDRDVSGSLPALESGQRGRSISVRGLSFSYADPEDPSAFSLGAIDLELSPGETVGIFGLTGAGKSTLLNVLARIYEPPPGTVFVGGVDVREVPRRQYWDALAYVPQDAFLFSRSIRDNIALSATADATEATRAALTESAATDAQLDADLKALPEGLDTRVGERGITLSGGQRQRAALARAFYRSFQVLLLDDVLSAVDHATEKRLIDAIYARGAGATALVVSHRISVLRRADRIVVMDGGRIVAAGQHDALIATQGPYAEAWSLQQARAAAEALAGEAGP